MTDRPGVVAVLLPNHAPFGGDWAEAAAMVVPTVTIEPVAKLSSPARTSGAGGIGSRYEYVSKAIPAGRLTYRVAAMANARRLGRCLALVEKDHGSVRALHTHYYHQAFPATYLKAQYPLIHTEHSRSIAADTVGVDAVYRLSRAGQRMAERVYRRADRVVAVSASLQRSIEAQFAEPSTVIANPVDCRLFRERGERDRRQVVAVGRLAEDKRPHLVLEAFAHAHALDKSLRLAFYGAGPMAGSLRSTARNLGIHEVVEFCGSVPREELAAALASCGAMLHAAQLETFGVAVAEALASGTPVVAFEVGALPELIHGTNGRLIPGSDPRELSRHLLEVLHSDVDHARIAAELRGKCSQEAVAEALETLYNDVAPASHGAAKQAGTTTEEQPMLNKIRSVAPTALPGAVWRKFVYREARMGRWGLKAGTSQLDAPPCPYRLEFWGPDRYRAILRTNEHLSDEDLDHFDRQESRCIVVLDGDRIAASSWMTRGDVYVHEIQRSLYVAQAEHFSCRSYVSPDYRGQSLFSHMVDAYAKQVPLSDEIWGLVYYWNQASVRSLENIGWRLSGEYWTRFIAGRQIAGERRFAPQPPGGKPPPRR